MFKEIELSGWCKESQRRGEKIEVFMVKEARGTNDQEVVQIAINPNFLAGLLKVGALTTRTLVR